MAVSGGPDSLLLAFLLAECTRETSKKMLALTVDHGLRTESAQEAHNVDAFLKTLGVQHRILPLALAKSTMHKRAREARYQALALWCHGHGIQHLFLGHHLDDQRETFLFRLMRGSSGWGLGGILPRQPLLGITLLRPFLCIPKSLLLQEAQRLNLPFAEDPSNTNPRFTRARLRQVWQTLPQESQDFWTGEMLRYARQKEQMWSEAQVLFPKTCVWETADAVKLDVRILKAHSTLAPALLYRLLSLYGGRGLQPLSYARVSDIWERCVPGFTTTLAGCILRVGTKHLTITRERPRRA